jgi:hypothetical protein
LGYAFIEEIRAPENHSRRNDILYNAIFDNFPSLAAFCRAHHDQRFHEPIIGQLINLKISPYTRKGSFSAVCKRLAAVTNIPTEVLFYEELYCKPNTLESQEVHMTDLSKRTRRGIRRIVEPTDSQLTIQAKAGDIQADISATLKGLSRIEQKVVNLTYGLFDGNTFTKKEIARILKLTPTRIGQIQAKALRKLQHPVRAQFLQKYVHELEEV